MGMISAISAKIMRMPMHTIMAGPKRHDPCENLAHEHGWYEPFGDENVDPNGSIVLLAHLDMLRQSKT
jgi:hypothetical protein